MKGYVVYPDGTCGFDELPMPKYDAYSALVKMESCGICNGKMCIRDSSMPGRTMSRIWGSASACRLP